MLLTVEQAVAILRIYHTMQYVVSCAIVSPKVIQPLVYVDKPSGVAYARGYVVLN